MRKDDSGIREWCKHTKNAAQGKRGVNKTNRRKVKDNLHHEKFDLIRAPRTQQNVAQ